MFMCQPKGGGKTHAPNSAVAVAIEGAMITYNINFDSKYKEKCTMSKGVDFSETKPAVFI